MLPNIRYETVGNTGVLALDLPEKLNAIDAPMLLSLTELLEKWAHDPQVAVVVLEGRGERAFCAGGDVVSLFHALRTGDVAGARRFFEVEYALDLSIHRYPKPILCLADRIVMGGGMGLMNGCSHRVVTERSMLAMPEITIGFYPDVGGTYFLSHAPGRLGLFCALTACRLNGGDALELRLADAFVPSSRLEVLRSEVLRQSWTTDADANHAHLSELVGRFRETPIPSEMARHRAQLDRLLDVSDVFALDALWRAEAHDTREAWFRKAFDGYLAGSPTSAAVIWEQMERGARLDVGAAFAQDIRTSDGFMAHPDLREGIRALLIDKDRNPRWSPARLEEVRLDEVRRHFF